MVPGQKRANRFFVVAAAATLLSIGVPSFLACGSSASDRRARIYTLKADAGPEAVAEIRDLLRDSDRDVRATALHALVSMGVPDALELATQGLEDPDGFVRATAAKCLEDVADPAALPLLADRLRNDADWHVRQRAADALARIGGEAAAAALADGLEDPVKEVRLAAVKGTGRIAPAASLDQLARLALEDPEWEIRAQAAWALGETGMPGAAEALRAVEADPNERVRAAAEKALRAFE